MRIDKKLNFVVPIYGEEKPLLDEAGKQIKNAEGRPVIHQPVLAYVHSTPLAEEIVDKHFLILGQTFSAIFNQGLGSAAGPGLAMRMLKKLAIAVKVWDDGPDGEKGVQNGLIEEMRRLTVVIVPAAEKKKGWQSIPLQIAVERKVIGHEDLTEVENAIVFFIAVSATLSRVPRKEMLETAAGLWSALLTSLNSSEFAASLKTSIVTDSSGEKSPADAIAASVSANAMQDGRPLSVPH